LSVVYDRINIAICRRTFRRNNASIGIGEAVLKVFLHVIARAKPEAIHWYSICWIASPDGSQWRLRLSRQPQGI